MILQIDQHWEATWWRRGLRVVDDFILRDHSAAPSGAIVESRSVWHIISSVERQTSRRGAKVFS